MSHEEQRTGQGQGVSKDMACEGKSGIAKTSDLSPEGAKGLCPLACTTQERWGGGGGGGGPEGGESHYLVFETNWTNWVRIFIQEQKAFCWCISPPPHSSREGGPWLRRKKALASETRVLLPELVRLTTSLNLGFPFSAKGPLIPTSQHCTLLFLTTV